ncbi:MAG TPA: LysM peptidoglycan-binding domain-containing protein [Gammaproteobacteria bacterium]|nr:LysM peptidoglycan-binding domain-containing protein [Gammaproteobacteria bacterium]
MPPLAVRAQAADNSPAPVAEDQSLFPNTPADHILPETQAEPPAEIPPASDNDTTAAQTGPLPETGDKPDPGPDNLWQRLRASFALPEGHEARVDAEVRWFSRHPQYLQRVAKRAGPYLYYIAEAVAERHMPGEIALLPAVESGFQPFAYSPGRAAGLWQFIPGTARRFGMKINWWYDGRRDVLLSTQGALDYLAYLRNIFDGDWLLALAAYNSGEGTVLKALRRNKRLGRPTDFWSLKLPRETRDYVPRLLAVAQIVAAPEKHHIELPFLASEPYFKVVETGGQLDLAVAAELAGLPLDDIYRLNPGFNRWATDPNGPHRLLLPVKAAAPFEARLATLPTDQRVRWQRHRIRNGETLSHIARRYHTTTALLREVNHLSGSMIRAGHHLVVPVSRRHLEHYELTAGQRRIKTLGTPRGGARKLVHQVTPGDTLWDLSRLYKVGVKQLAAWNAMAPGDYLRPGQELVIWRKAGTITPATALRTVEQKITYTVRRGDSLARISQRFNVSVKQLLRWNALKKNDYLQPGQRLTLYINVTNLPESS